MRAFNNLTNDFQRLVAGRSIARDLDAVGINFYPAERAFQVKIYTSRRGKIRRCARQMRRFCAGSLRAI